MSMMTPGRFIRSLKKSPIILDAILRDVSQAQAEQLRDSPEGWNIVEVVCHLRDFEEFFFHRARLMLEQTNPELPAYDHEAIAIERAYAHQNLATALRQFKETRQQHVEWLKALQEADWQRPGRHPENGDITIIEQAMQVALHTVDHIEQIVHILDTARDAAGVN